MNGNHSTYKSAIKRRFMARRSFEVNFERVSDLYLESTYRRRRHIFRENNPKRTSLMKIRKILVGTIPKYALPKLLAVI